jgi:uncharacterized protein (DUF983 family)
MPLVFLVEVNWQPAWWVHLALWGPMAGVLSLWLLPVVKGAIIAAAVEHGHARLRRRGAARRSDANPPGHMNER